MKGITHTMINNNKIATNKINTNNTTQMTISNEELAVLFSPYEQIILLGYDPDDIEEDIIDPDSIPDMEDWDFSDLEGGW